MADCQTWLNRIARSEFVVYAKPPFGGPKVFGEAGPFSAETFDRAVLFPGPVLIRFSMCPMSAPLILRLPQFRILQKMRELYALDDSFISASESQLKMEYDR